MQIFSRCVLELWFQEDAQDMIEYSLLLVFIALAAIGLLSGVKHSLNTIWTKVLNVRNAY
jgi:Flp pilus assembly pilin Flp